MRRENLWLPATVDWSYRADLRFELRSRSDPASWLEEPYRCVVIGCLLIDLVMLSDSYLSMIVRFASPVTTGFLSPLLLSLLSCLIVVKENLWDQGSIVVMGTKKIPKTLAQNNNNINRFWETKVTPVQPRHLVCGSQDKEPQMSS